MGDVTYRPPFPWFGGKSRVSDIVWKRFGNTPNYVELFFGSGAVMFLRPHDPKTETVNDLDCFVANFWRALQANPEEVTRWADWPVNEADLHARHQWLVNQPDFISQMHSDPDFYDCKIAGWWVWGISQWIGSGWCSLEEKPSGKLPHLGNPGMGDLYGYMLAISERLRNVRVCCGQWDRILGPSPTEKLGITAVFLDPPYGHTDRDSNLYAVDSMTVAQDVANWALENGDNPMLRIALCGYEGEFDPTEGWETVEWKASGGFASQNAEYNDNPHKERIWFSPHCIRGIKQPPLFVLDAPKHKQMPLVEA
jgi:DNA adenine methylase